MPERQRRFVDVVVGDCLPVVTFPLPVYRLVMAAAGTRDFTAVHHNDDYARSVGAPAMYANAGLLLGMWERPLRDYIGVAGTIRAIREFRMVRFNIAGSLVRVEGQVLAKERRAGCRSYTSSCARWSRKRLPWARVGPRSHCRSLLRAA